MSQFRTTLRTKQRIMHSTNYYNHFIQVAEDCPASEAQVPPLRGEKKSVANYQFDMVIDHPYEYTSDEVIFTVYAIRKGISKADWEEERIKFFSKGQPCFRASPLTKRYGWGLHSNAEGKIALYPLGGEEYQQFVEDSEVDKALAMRSKRK